MSPVSFSQGRYSMDLMKKRGKVLIFNYVPVFFVPVFFSEVRKESVLRDACELLDLLERASDFSAVRITIGRL